MKTPHQFIAQHPDEESISEQQCAPALLEEYIRGDAERANGVTSYPIVYDYVDPSPHYDASDPYLDEKDLIELPPVS